MTFPDTDVLVVGAGPAGLVAALTLSLNKVPCIVVERNHGPTNWPKMDLTNCRSMELLRRLGVSEGWKALGVPQHFSLDVLFSTGLGDAGETFARWNLPSPSEWRERILQTNDGSQPLEPWLRGSQTLFEAYLRRILESDPLVDLRYGIKFETLDENENGVESKVTDESGKISTIRSKFILGCDGGGSRVRRSLGIEVEGGPLPGAMYLIHFKSRDLSILHRQGRFWHIFFSTGAVLISQDEDATWTCHTPVEVDTDISTLDPYETLSKSLAGAADAAVPLQIDEILVSSLWHPNVSLAKTYTSPGRRAFLAGDAAHQTVPAGGYGMNTALGDSYDIAWKLAATLHGYAGPALLASYEIERRPTAEHNLEQAKKHWSVHSTFRSWAREARNDISDHSKKRNDVQAKIRQFVESNAFENQDYGTELDYRFPNSPVVTSEPKATSPKWNRSQYTPSTWPGSRAPNVHLKQDSQDIFELLGSGAELTIVDFTTEGKYACAFATEAERLGIPLKKVHLPAEPHARNVWERDAVLIRPDDFVAWRAGENVTADIDSRVVTAALTTAVGRKWLCPSNG